MARQRHSAPQLIYEGDQVAYNEFRKCACGCGGEIQSEAFYIRGHHMRMAKRPEQTADRVALHNSKNQCGCGCGAQIKPGDRFLKGHNRRTPEHCHVSPDDPRGPNPSGKCGCGCGGTTTISGFTHFGRNQLVGCYTNFIHGHGQTVTPQVGNPSGLCLCGCGRPTPIAQQTRRGNITGQPLMYVLGHRVRKRYTVNLETGCWEQPVHRLDGYSRVRWDGQLYMGHIWYWQQWHGPVPEGMQLDHLCRVRKCVNPDHMEVVTPEENIRRIYAEREFPRWSDGWVPIIDPDTGCWNFPVTQPDGYARVLIGRNLVMAHRIYFSKAGRRIPADYELHHLCENRACVNPDHIEPLSHDEHVERTTAQRKRRAA